MSDRPIHGLRQLSADGGANPPGADETTAPELLNPGIRRKIDEFVAHHPGGTERLMPLLRLAQEPLGYLPLTVQEHIADRLGLPLVQLQGVVSFYHFFNTTPRGEHQLKVCMGTACFVRRARALTEAIEQVLGVRVGSVTKDQLFGLQEVRCRGSCGRAPVMTFDEETYGDLTPGDARQLVLGRQVRARRERLHGSAEEPDG